MEDGMVISCGFLLRYTVMRYYDTAMVIFNTDDNLEGARIRNLSSCVCVYYNITDTRR
jgi:hypothetical protein